MAKKKQTAKKPATPKKAAKKKVPSKRAKRALKQRGKLSALDAAARVLGEATQPMNCTEMIEAMAVKGYWKSPAGRTPHATLHAAISREIHAQGKDARFKKVQRGKFAGNGESAADPTRQASRARTG